MQPAHALPAHPLKGACRVSLTESQIIRRSFEEGEGIFRLAPAWVPRVFCVPGRRMKLDPRDLYAYGAHRGGIDERWLASTITADNGPLTTPNEGLSEIVWHDGSTSHRALLRDAVQEMGASLLGETLWAQYQRWPVFAKFFDNRDPLPHHLHQNAAQAALVGQEPKPEAYYFPRQLNNHGGVFPHTYFGIEPGTSPAQIRQCLADWHKGDNGILQYARAMKLELGTGWYVPTGLLHAPGSLLTYEPQWASDVYSMFQSLVADVPIAWENCVRNVPPEFRDDLDYLVSLVDWEANTVPSVRETYFRPPRDVAPRGEMVENGCIERLIVYGNPDFAAWEMTVLPGRAVTVSGPSAHGLIVVQGHGAINEQPLESPTLIRFGEETCDEYFVSAQAAQRGVTYRNTSAFEPLVVLKHFGPDAAIE